MNDLRCGTVDINVRRLLPTALTIGLLAALLASTSAVYAKSKPKLSYFDRLALANWKHVMRVDKSDKHWRPTGMLLIAAKPTEVMATFMDFNTISTFMPKVKSCRVVRRRGKHAIWAVVILKFPWPVANAWVAVKYNWTATPDGGYHLTWLRHRGSMKKYWGMLTLLPWGKHWSLAISTMQAVPDIHISRSRLNKGMVWGTQQLLHHLRAEVDRRRRRGVLKPYKP